MKKISYLLLALALGYTTYSCSSDDSTNNPVEKPEDKPTDPETPEEPKDPETPEEPETPGDNDLNMPEDQVAYYADVDFSKTGLALKQELAKSVKAKHTNEQKYQWNHFKETDLTPEGNEVYLLYGHKGVTQGTKAYTRGKDKHGGNVGDWNREHVYARSLANPKLETKSAGAGTDAHNLRPSDVTWNATRDNFLFVEGEGFSDKIELAPGVSSTEKFGWYPGDEWKGDVARMMMYMYIRYDNQCLPTGVALGKTNDIDPNMVDILLKWNAEDPVSEIERKRNTYHGNTNNTYAQGNRNPFIDNPNLATQIWGGKEAENLWK